MSIEHRSGNTPGVRQAHNELVAKLNEYGTTPSAETTTLLGQLLQPGRNHTGPSPASAAR